MVYPTKLDEAKIIAQAFHLLDAQGIEGLSIRKLAQALGVSPSSLYRYFPERALVLQALESSVSLTLHQKIHEQTHNLDANARFISTAHTYLGYARDNPNRYALFFQHYPDNRYAPAQSNSKALWNQVLATVGALTGDADDTAAAVAFWSFLHGFIVLEQSGSFGASGAKGGFERGLGALLTGFTTTRSPA